MRINIPFLNHHVVGFILLFFISFKVNGQSNPPFQVNWINRVGVNTTRDILTKNVAQASWTNSGAISSNLLLANTDGWVEFTVATGSYFAIGFSTTNTINVTQFTNGIVIVPAGNFNSFEGSTGTFLGNWQAGDVFRIAREGSAVKYLRNGDLLKSVAVDPGLELKLKTSLPEFGRSTPVVTTSFDMRLVLQSTILGVESNGGMGSVSLNVIGGILPYAYSWSSGEQTSSINTLQGAYTVTVSDASGRTQTRTYSIGYKINWIERIGVNASGDVLTKNVAMTSWTNSGAISSNLLPANTNGWMEFTTVNSSYFAIGFAINNTINFTRFSDGIIIDNSTGNSTGMQGTTPMWRVNWQIGDVFRISRKGSTVTYSRNGVVLDSVAVNPAFELKVKTSLWNFDGVHLRSLLLLT